MEAPTSSLKTCRACGRPFVPRFSYQVLREGGTEFYYCSQRCLLNMKAKGGEVACSVCGQRFTPQMAYQRAILDGQPRFYCSHACADTLAVEQRRKSGRKRIAVLNQKGGTGKTTTAVNLSAALATRGFRVLLIDMDAQGNVGVSLGIQGEQGTYHLLIEGAKIADIAVPIRNNLEIVTSNESLAAAEILMARMERREMKLRHALIDEKGDDGFDYVILDCPPSLSLVNQNALVYADDVLVPVSCDFLAMVGVKQILRTIERMNTLMGQPISILGVLPTFYDPRTNLSKEVLATLRDYFKDKTLPPVRMSTRIKEAPSHRKTIFEYAPSSTGAADYLAVVDRLLARPS